MTISISSKKFALPIVGMLLWSGVALGEPSSSPPASAQLESELTGQARMEYEAGVALLGPKSPDPHTAILHFQEAYRLSQNPRLYRKIAACYRGMHRYVAAVQALKTYQERVHLGQAESEEVDRITSALRDFVGRLRVNVDQRGAKIEVTDTAGTVFTYVGISPLAESVNLDEGTHRLRVSKPGFVVDERIIAIPGHEGETSVSLTLRPATGRLVVHAKPATASITVDGKMAAVGLYDGSLMPGAHELVVSANGMESHSQTVAITQDGTSSYDVTLREQPQRTHWAWWIAGGAVVTAGVVIGIAAATSGKDVHAETPQGAMGTIAMPVRW